MDEIINEAREYALGEIEKYGTPIPPHLDLTAQVAARLAANLGADISIVKVGTYLMDLKLGEAKKNDRLSEHAKLSAESGTLFLQRFGLEKDVVDKIVNCIEAHHGNIPYKSMEAEICANADCYRFIHPRGVFAAFAFFGKRYATLEECLDFVEKKLDEKYAILSLDICKEELEKHYHTLKEQIAQARQKG